MTVYMEKYTPESWLQVACTRKCGFNHINFPVIWEILHVWVKERRFIVGTESP